MSFDFSDNFFCEALGETVRVLESSSVTGGSINRCSLVSLDDGRTLFIKTHQGRTIPGMYAAEARALTLLAQPGTLAVPEPLYFDDDCLILEAFRHGSPAQDWLEKMGRGLALLHQGTQQESFGFECDNFLGTTPQVNSWQDDWLTFWRSQRLGFQFRLFSQQAHENDPLITSGEKLLENLGDILACDAEPAVLLHGDLWSGNAGANEKGEPVIYDPASYYGHREAEIGMMRLFGGFGPRCEAAYEEVWPLQDGSDRRIEVYKLYHQLNHLNLFGGGYYDGCLVTVRSLL